MFLIIFFFLFILFKLYKNNVSNFTKIQLKTQNTHTHSLRKKEWSNLSFMMLFLSFFLSLSLSFSLFLSLIFLFFPSLNEFFQTVNRLILKKFFFYFWKKFFRHPKRQLNMHQPNDFIDEWNSKKTHSFLSFFSQKKKQIFFLP